MSRKLRTLILGAAASAVIAAFPVAARAAAPAPYTDWSFDLKRAGENAAAWSELARKAPSFARIWFYGQVYDLATVGVTDEVKAHLRPRLEAIARVLAEGETPDTLPTLLLDRARAGTLEAASRRTRQVEDELVEGARGGQFEAAKLAAAAHPEQARIVFFRLLARAETTRLRLGGEREAALLVGVARRIADGYALAVDDLALWGTLAAWQGSPGVAVGKELVVDLQVAAGLNAALSGDFAGARRQLESALSTARAAHGTTFYAALILNGTANMAARAGDVGGAMAIRRQVVAQIRPMNDPGLQALLADQLVKTYLQERNAPETALYTRELRGLGERVTQAPDYLATLARAAKFLAEAAAAEEAQARLAPAVLLFTEVGQIQSLLKGRDVVAATEPSDRVETVRVDRERAYAETHRALAGIEVRRGQRTAARAAYEQALAIYESVGAMDGAGATRLELARVDLDGGDFDQALASTEQALAALAYGAPEARARGLALRGEIRLRRGEHAAAFENANAGLQVLRDTGDPDRFVVERGALHRLAALALDAGGQPAAARERLAFARSVHPAAETILLQAQLAFEASDPMGVEAAFKDVPEAVIDARVRAVYRGCTQARLGRHAEAATTLAGVSSLVAANLRPLQIAGRTCLAAAHLGAGQAQAAANAVVPARALAAEFGDPALVWRVSALEAEVAVGLGNPGQAATAWRFALDRFADALAERPDLGHTADLRLPALPAAPTVALREAPGALATSTAGLKPDEAAVNLAASVAYAQFARQLEAGAPLFEPNLADYRPAGELAVRSAHTAWAAARRPLRDPAVEGSDRAPAVVAAAAAGVRFRDARATKAAESPAWFAYVSPTVPPPRALAPPDGEARIFYRVGESAGRIWLWLPGEAGPRSYVLPGQAALAALLAPALEATLHPPVAYPAKVRPGAKDPNAKDYEALAKPTATVLPFLADKKLAARLTGLTLRVYPDGPLSRFPMEALIVAPAPRGVAKAPVFFGARHRVTFGLLPLQPATPVTPGAGDAARAWATVGPLAATGGCPPVELPALKGLYDPCAGPDATAEAEKVAGLFATAPEAAAAFVAYGGANADAQRLQQALNEARTVHLMLPVDTRTGEVLLSQADPAAPASAYPASGVALARAKANLVVVTRPSAGALETETSAGLDRFVAALRYAGVPAVALSLYRNGAELDADTLVGAAGAALSGSPVADAFAAERQGALASTVDPKLGGVPQWHPWFWARWRVF
ncbi:tetratricopeptide repeat protein [Myxococcota bacterium]|nr:tetratricopeptide repeat protein [Myxococcota bacterium]